jgi:hypothetical protein
MKASNLFDEEARPGLHDGQDDFRAATEGTIRWQTVFRVEETGP